MKKTIRIGHSPDADDAFIFFGLAKGLAKIEGYEVQHVVESIESLNQRALNAAELEVTAVSVHAYAHLTDKYALLSCGGSFGRKYGPIVVSNQDCTIDSLKGKKVAVPGKLTTAFLIAQMYLPQFEPVQVAFDEVFEMVRQGKVAAGVVIHEGQLTYAKEGMKKIFDLGQAWTDETRLPLPLGIDVVRKDLGKEVMLAVWKGLKDSIDIAIKHEDEALDYSLQFGRGVDRKIGREFIAMYANNKDTFEMGKEGEEAIRLLFEKAARKGILKPSYNFEVIRGK
ncbi:MAG: ABC transporter substrate-binding protein [Candidatus Riflebacteria bacterium]|nr:ABC transporter substrate-binding protein [Candidatus Riflebacteria bacterium]